MQKGCRQFSFSPSEGERVGVRGKRAPILTVQPLSQAPCQRCWLCSCWAGRLAPPAADPIPRTSRIISSVLREPLPAEAISLSETAKELVLNGPTFTYRVQKATGAISAIRVVRDGQEVITTSGPADIQIDQYRLVSELNSCKVTIDSQGKDKIIVRAEGILRDPAKRGPEVDYTLVDTFFNDGVVVSRSAEHTSELQ